MWLHHVYQLSYLIFGVIRQGHLHMVQFGGATTFLQLTWGCIKYGKSHPKDVSDLQHILKVTSPSYPWYSGRFSTLSNCNTAFSVWEIVLHWCLQILDYWSVTMKPVLKGTNTPRHKFKLSKFSLDLLYPKSQVKSNTYYCKSNDFWVIVWIRCKFWSPTLTLTFGPQNQ